MWFRPSRIYMDFAAATPLVPSVARAMHAAEHLYGNPSGLHARAHAAKEALEKARVQVARALECKPKEVVFCAGGTEANNIVIQGVLRTHPHAHAAAPCIEHSSVLEPLKAHEAQGGACSFIPVRPDGTLSLQVLAASLRPETSLVVLGWVNSEVGTIQPLHALVQEVRAHERRHGTQVHVHIDAGQAPLTLSTVVAGIGADTITLDAGKFYGPRAAAALYVRRGVTISPLFYGGGQERGLRPGTESVVGAIGCATALAHVQVQRTKEHARYKELAAHFFNLVHNLVPRAVQNGSSRGAPHIANISIPGIDAEYVAFALDAAGIEISTKSACDEEKLESHVVRALCGGEDAWRARTALRFSFGNTTSVRDVERAVRTLADIVGKSESLLSKVTVV